MKRQSDCDIQNRLKEAAGQETPPLWGRIEAGLRDTRYSFEAAEEPATRKNMVAPAGRGGRRVVVPGVGGRPDAAVSGSYAAGFLHSGGEGGAVVQSAGRYPRGA